MRENRNTPLTLFWYLLFHMSACPFLSSLLRSGAYANVICQHDEFDIENRALSHTTDGNACALLIVAIESWLWSIRGIVQNYRCSGRRGTAEASCFGRELLQSFPNLLRTWRRASHESN